MKTEYWKIDPYAPLEPQLADAASVLAHGGLVAFPTETVYGLGADATDAAAASRIYAAKGRPSDNPLIVHIAHPADAGRYAVTGELYERLSSAFMPGPLTVVMPRRGCIPLSVTGGLDSVGIRCPENRIARTLIRLAGVPVAAPSANLSGRPSPTSARHVWADLDGKIDGILDGGDCTVGLESTVVKLCGDRVTVLRPGAVTPEMLREVCPHVTLDAGITEKLPEGVAPQAPGMKYRHYAPRARVVLIRDAGHEDFDRRAVLFLEQRLREEPAIGILCFDEYGPYLHGKNVMTFGKKQDDAEHARRLFDCLRRFDETDAPEIYAVAGAPDGLGLALYNRMLKAAGYTVLDL